MLGSHTMERVQEEGPVKPAVERRPERKAGVGVGGRQETLRRVEVEVELG